MGYVITTQDIACIERLVGYLLADGLKDYLFRIYGEGGECEEYQAIIARCPGPDPRACEKCQACAYETGESLLTQIGMTVMCHERGELDVAHGNYHGVKGKFSLKWAYREDPTLPF